jgi:lipoprotein-anchoring transpeptidase ErfK/SrfK
VVGANNNTPTGTFRIYVKRDSQTMSGVGYSYPNRDWAINIAYWHNNFGTPVSHGCINMRDAEAQIVYEWASIGTRVYIHR